MKTKTYNNQNITAYLLGVLPEPEAEIFDELSFTDDEFVDDLNAAEKDLVDAFVGGELKGDQLEQFKTYYLASPVRRGKVEFAQSFQSFAGKKLASESVEAAPKPRVPFLARLFTIPRLSLQWGFAFATLALIFLGGWLFWENSRLRSEIAQTQSSRDQLLKRESELAQREKQLVGEISNQQTINSQGEKELAQVREERQRLTRELKNSEEQKRLLEKRKVAPSPNERELAQDGKKRTDGEGIGMGSPPKIISFVLLPSLRGGSQLPTLSIPSETDYVAFRLQLEIDDFPSYRVVLQNPADNQILWRTRSTVKAKGKNKTLNLQIPAKLLNSQIYSLEVSGVTAGGTEEIISNYSFRAVLK